MILWRSGWWEKTELFFRGRIKEISFDLDIVDTGKNSYEFYAGDLLFQTVTLKGDIMTYGVGEGDDAQIFVFERDK